MIFGHTSDTLSTRGNTVVMTRRYENYHNSSKRRSENPESLLIEGFQFPILADWKPTRPQLPFRPGEGSLARAGVRRRSFPGGSGGGAPPTSSRLDQNIVLTGSSQSFPRLRSWGFLMSFLGPIKGLTDSKSVGR